MNTEQPKDDANAASAPAGDCWLLAAVANITMNQELFAQIVPSDQEMDDGYAGIFHSR